MASDVHRYGYTVSHGVVESNSGLPLVKCFIYTASEALGAYFDVPQYHVLSTAVPRGRGMHRLAEDETGERPEARRSPSRLDHPDILKSASNILLLL